MKKLFVTVCLIMLFNASLSNADCISDCKVLIKAADKVIADLNEEVSLYKIITETQTNQIASLNVSINDKNQELSSVWRNPWLLGTIGILIGGGATLYLTK